MGLHGSCGHTQFLDVLGSDMNYLIDVLESTFDEQKLGIRHKRPASLVKLRIDDGVGDAGFVFDGKKDEAVGSARTLSRNHAAGNASFNTMSQKGKISRPYDSHRAKLLAAVRHGMSSHRHSG
jgi:hypothetical protein